MTSIDKRLPNVERILLEAENLELELVEGQTFERQDVLLDGRRFKDCRFILCKIIVEIGVFALEGQIHFQRCSFDLRGPSARLRGIVEQVSASKKSSRRK